MSPNVCVFMWKCRADRDLKSFWQTLQVSGPSYKILKTCILHNVYFYIHLKRYKENFSINIKIWLMTVLLRTESAWRDIGSSNYKHSLHKVSIDLRNKTLGLCYIRSPIMVRRGTPPEWPIATLTKFLTLRLFRGGTAGQGHGFDTFFFGTITIFQAKKSENCDCRGVSG